MNRKVVVENTLTPYIDYFKSSGYDVHTLYKNSNIKNITSTEYDAIIVSGMDVLSIKETSFQNPPIPIIEIRGQTPEEVYNMVESRNIK